MWQYGVDESHTLMHTQSGMKDTKRGISGEGERDKGEGGRERDRGGERETERLRGRERERERERGENQRTQQLHELLLAIKTLRTTKDIFTSKNANKRTNIKGTDIASMPHKTTED